MGKTITACQLLRLPVGRASGWYRPAVAGGVQLATPDGWMCTVVSAIDEGWRHRAIDSAAVRLTFTASRMPSEVPRWRSIDRPRNALPRDEGLIECSMVVDGSARFLLCAKR